MYVPSVLDEAEFFLLFLSRKFGSLELGNPAYAEATNLALTQITFQFCYVSSIIMSSSAVYVTRQRRRDARRMLIQQAFLYTTSCVCVDVG